MEKFSELKEIKDFKIISKIGRGAIGFVYKAFNVKTGALVAVKQIKLSSLHQNIEEKKRKSFRTEIKLLKFMNHPNIVSLLDFDEDENYLNLVLEYMENGSLSALIATVKDGEEGCRPFNEILVRSIILQVLHGLEYLHSCNIIHRDVKGANILLDKTGCVKLSDFGVAKLLQEEFKENCQNSFVGTPYWMAPEIIYSTEAHKVSCQSDVWSVGCTIIECVTGTPPYAELDHYQAFYSIVSDEHPPMPSNVSKECEDLLLSCFKKNPNERPPVSVLLRHKWFREVIPLYNSITSQAVKPNATGPEERNDRAQNSFNFKSSFLPLETSPSGSQTQFISTSYIESLYFQPRISKSEFIYLVRAYFGENDIEDLDATLDLSFLFSEKKYSAKDFPFVRSELMKVLYHMINSSKAKEFLDSMLDQGLLGFVFDALKLQGQDEELLYNAVYFIGKAIYMDKKRMSVIVSNSSYLFKFMKFLEVDDVDDMTLNFSSKYCYIMKLGTDCLLELIRGHLSFACLERLLERNLVPKLLLVLNLEIADEQKELIDLDLYEILMVVVRKTKNKAYGIKEHYLQAYICDELVYDSLLLQVETKAKATNVMLRLLVLLYELIGFKSFRDGMETRGLTPAIIKLIIGCQTDIEKKNGLAETNLNLLHLLLAILDIAISKAHNRLHTVAYFTAIKGIELLDSLFNRNEDSKVRAFTLQLFISLKTKNNVVFQSINKGPYARLIEADRTDNHTLELDLMTYNFFKTYFDEFAQDSPELALAYRSFVKGLQERMGDHDAQQKSLAIDMKETMSFLNSYVKTMGK